MLPREDFGRRHEHRLMSMRDGQEHFGIQLHDVANFIAADQSQLGSGCAVNFQIERPAEMRGIASETLAELPVRWLLVVPGKI